MCTAHRVRVGVFTVLRQLRQKATFTVLCQFQALVTFTDLPPKKPKFSTGALRAPPGKPPQHNTPPPHPRLAPLPPHLPALPPAHPSHVVFHRVEVSGNKAWLRRRLHAAIVREYLDANEGRGLGVARLLPLLYSFTGE